MPARNSIVWFRRDLRADDHGAIGAAHQSALAAGGRVFPLFVADQNLLDESSVRRKAMLRASLRSLEVRGVPVRILYGKPEAVIPLAARELDADVYVSEDFAPYGIRRDLAVSAALEVAGYQLNAADSAYVVEPGVVRKDDGTPFKVFTPFSRKWELVARSVVPIPASERVWADSEDIQISGLSRSRVEAFLPELPEVPAWLQPALAVASLEKFVSSGLHTYDRQRDMPAASGTSRVSTWLKFGVVHPRTVAAAVAQSNAAQTRGANVFLSELCWREFYADVLFHRPDSAWTNLAAGVDLPCDSGPIADERFDAWCHGQTGYPFVDAGMRQLLAEGWMHNRLRMVTASFLVKDLHLPWQRGARWFMEQLYDADLASNQHGWQWTAGTGTDAAPYFRIFNPITQGKRFDPDGHYIRRWVPELAHLPAPAVHEPWASRQRPAAALFGGSTLDYPLPIVDHAEERADSLRRYAHRTEAPVVGDSTDSVP